ncbi:MAG: hypothetical protein ACK478_00250 [Flavobacteriales bacterium]
MSQLIIRTESIKVRSTTFFIVNTPNENTSKPEEVNDLKAQVEMLQAEKLKLEAELKSREEMMSNLLSFIQASK